MVKLKVIPRMTLHKRTETTWSCKCPNCGVGMFAEDARRFLKMKNCPYCNAEIRAGDVMKDE